MSSTEVKKQMVRLDPAFNEKVLGFSSFSAFVKSREEVAELDESSQNRRVRLRD
ncbi:OST-HTH/LOTUS domain-containing protein [Microcella indica]|uniref:OST-HTH/LOTUS domain-containing protein n=1 Tax=Microcella indica TaxID=2750620 RepID=UPI001CD10FA6|nr:OST-HTH/LOTUS domain-containing protein [Microcella indica]